MSLIKKLLSVIAFSALFASNSYAGPYTNDLSKCLVSSTSVQDRTTLVKWMFMAFSLHPEVEGLTKVSENQINKVNKKTADLIIRLLTDSCRQNAKDALKFEGQGTIEASFNVLGSVAGRELATNPKVAAAMGGIEKFLDVEKLKSLSPNK